MTQTTPSAPSPSTSRQPVLQARGLVKTFGHVVGLAGVDPNYQVLATGVLVILAVAVDQWIRRVRA